MNNSLIWGDFINKAEDLGLNIEGFCDDVLPTLPLSKDAVVGPIALRMMNEVTVFCFNDF